MRCARSCRHPVGRCQHLHSSQAHLTSNRNAKSGVEWKLTTATETAVVSRDCRSGMVRVLLHKYLSSKQSKVLLKSSTKYFRCDHTADAAVSPSGRSTTEIIQTACVHIAYFLLNQRCCSFRVCWFARTGDYCTQSTNQTFSLYEQPNETDRPKKQSGGGSRK